MNVYTFNTFMNVDTDLPCNITVKEFPSE